MESVIGGVCPWAAGGQAETILGGFIQLLLASYCGIHNPAIWPKDRADDLLDKNYIQNYDFIVVGAGSAGSAVSRRLAEENWKVLLLEAGGDPTPESEIPAMAHATQSTSINWKYLSEENPNYCQAMVDQRCHIPRGKTLGGSSAINYMIYARGIKEDYEEWEAMGNKGWGYESVMKYFRKQEGLHPVVNYNSESEDYGSDGPLNIESYAADNPWKDVIKNAWMEKGYGVMNHINEESLRGIAEAFGTIKAGQRWSSAKAYLSNMDENLQNNLHVVKNAHVMKLIMDETQKRVTGVKVRIGNKDVTIEATKEVILSAGAINSPQILMLSGIGPKQHLEDIGVQPIIADLPVGKNLKDHVLFPIILRPDISHGVFTNEMLIHTMSQYLLQRSGVLSTIGMTDLLGYINVDDPKSTVPNVQIVHFYAPINDSFFIPNLIAGFMYDDEYKNAMIETNTNFENLYILPALLKPQSKGKIELSSLDPMDAPKIYVNHYEDKEDIETMMKGIKFVEMLEQSETFKAAGLKIKPIELKNCPHKPRTDDYWRCMIRQVSSTVYHQVGTAKMGPKSDRNSVVDPRLRVHGVKGLRVIDASIMPDIIRGNTNAPSIMIGEMGADLIKQDWKNAKKEEL